MRLIGDIDLARGIPVPRRIRLILSMPLSESMAYRSWNLPYGLVLIALTYIGYTQRAGLAQYVVYRFAFSARKE